jgi:hypothetical protein
MNNVNTIKQERSLLVRKVLKIVVFGLMAVSCLVWSQKMLRIRSVVGENKPGKSEQDLSTQAYISGDKKVPQALTSTDIFKTTKDTSLNIDPVDSTVVDSSNDSSTWRPTDFVDFVNNFAISLPELNITNLIFVPWFKATPSDEEAVNTQSNVIAARLDSAGL